MKSTFRLSVYKSATDGISANIDIKRIFTAIENINGKVERFMFQMVDTDRNLTYRFLNRTKQIQVNEKFTQDTTSFSVNKCLLVLQTGFNFCITWKIDLLLSKKMKQNNENRSFKLIGSPFLLIQSLLRDYRFSLNEVIGRGAVQGMFDKWTWEDDGLLALSIALPIGTKMVQMMKQRIAINKVRYKKIL